MLEEYNNYLIFNIFYIIFMSGTVLVNMARGTTRIIKYDHVRKPPTVAWVFEGLTR